jgi:hypothetical protein
VRPVLSAAARLNGRDPSGAGFVASVLQSQPERQEQSIPHVNTVGS